MTQTRRNKKHPPPVLETGDDIPPPMAHREGDIAWRDMKVGQSYYFEGRRYGAINRLAWGATQRLGYKFTVRKVTNGTRVWRIK